MGANKGGNKVETRFRRLHLGFRGCLDERNTDRHRNMHALCSIQHGDLETGSTYKLGGAQGRDLIPMATPRFSRMPRRTEHCPTSKYARVVLTYNYFRFRRRRVEFCTTRAYFDVGQCFIRTGVIENLGVAVGIVFLPL